MSSTLTNRVQSSNVPFTISGEAWGIVGEVANQKHISKAQLMREMGAELLPELDALVMGWLSKRRKSNTYENQNDEE